jgi:hypothetical protein
MKRLAVGCALFAGMACTAMAATVYRCGPDGRTYSQLPCHQGDRVDVSDRRSAQDLAEGQRAARIDRSLADSLQKDRIEREKTLPRLGNLSPRPDDGKGEAKGAAPSSKSGKKKPKDFSVKLPKPKKPPSP